MKISTWEDDDDDDEQWDANGVHGWYLVHTVQSHILEPSQRCQQGSRSSKLHGLRKGVWPDALDAIH
jgi:hypothetical protein